MAPFCPINKQDGNYVYLKDSEGLIEVRDYYTSTTATSTIAGGVAGYIAQTKLRRGETGSDVVLSTTKYFAHTTSIANGAVTTYPVAEQTVYRTAGDGGQTTSYASEAWSTAGVPDPGTGNQDTSQPQQVRMTYPTVAASENGPGTAALETNVYDLFGRMTQQTDADGFVHTWQYDAATGAVTQTVVDAGAGHLNLTTQIENDPLGRPTRITDPNGNVTYRVYKDTDHEVRVYAGWQATPTPTTTGPVLLVREDRAQQYSEMLTMAVTPAVDGSGRPTGSEAVANLRTLTRDHVNAAGQVVESRRYFDLTGLVYTTAAALGVSGTHYDRTDYGYDSRGRANKVLHPTGTLERTVRDAPGRVVSTWVGTNDTGATHADPTGGGALGNNMVQVSASQYDGGNVGDSNLTQATASPCDGTPDRVTNCAPARDPPRREINRAGR